MLSSLRLGATLTWRTGNSQERVQDRRGVLIGLHLNKSFMAGVGVSFARYKLTHFDNDFRRIATEEEPAHSSIVVGRWRFRAHGKFQPYIDAGIGITEVVGIDGDKTSFTFGLGAQYKFNDRWAIAIESRGLGWSNRSTGSPEGANEFTLSWVRFVR